MSKPILVLQAPIATRSGYGDHARDILRSLYKLDKFDIKLIPTQWGATPQNQLDPKTEFGKRAIGDVITKLDKKPDVYVQLTIANEFRPIGNYNIGITAGVETTLAPQEFLTASNTMDLLIVPSKFTKDTLEKTVYEKLDKNTHKSVGQLQLEKPVEVLFEGVNLDTYTGKSTDSSILDNDSIPDFNFLMAGHWLQGDLGQDRKDIGMTIQTFCTVFKDIPKDKQPGLILKTSAAGFSIGDREVINDKIKSITNTFGDKCPPIFLLFGDMSEEELNNLYNHPKVKSMVMFTKGEGYGRPLAEFATTGKPIIVSKWSGHTDFLPEANTIYLPGELTKVHESTVNKFILNDSSWFTVNYSVAAQQLYNVYQRYDTYLKHSKGLRSNIIKNFSLDKMTDELGKIFDKYKVVPEKIELKLPTIHKL